MDFKPNLSISSLTTLNIGGPAKEFIEVKSEEELMNVLSKLPTILIIGGGSNLLVSDSPFDGLVIKNEITGIARGENKEERRHLHAQLVGRAEQVTRPSMKVSSEKGKLIVKSGTKLQDLVDYTIQNSLSGMHKLTGIPGTVGGAIFGNAGAFGQTISDHLVRVTALDPIAQNTSLLTKDECGFDYRDSGFKRNSLIILEVEFSLSPQNKETLQKEAEEVLEKRLKKYPKGVKCPGSFFKNLFINKLSPDVQKLIPKDRDFYGKVPAWYFLDEVGAKGDRLGDIQIAPYHGNLFINLGGGKAEDFYNLAKKYYDLVREKFGISLEPEVQLINLPALNQL